MLTAWESYLRFASVWKAVNTRWERLEWYGKVGTFKHNLFSHQKHQLFTNELESTFSWQCGSVATPACLTSITFFWHGSLIFSCGSVHIELRFSTFISLVLSKTHKEAMWVFPDSWKDIDKLFTLSTDDCLHNLLTTLQLLLPPLPLDKCPKVAPLDVGKSVLTASRCSALPLP